MRGAKLSESAKMAFDLGRLYWHALLRNRRRIEKDGALDDMLRHKTELTLVVRERDISNSGSVKSNDVYNINGKYDARKDRVTGHSGPSLEK